MHPFASALRIVVAISLVAVVVFVFLARRLFTDRRLAAAVQATGILVALAAITALVLTTRPLFPAPGPATSPPPSASLSPEPPASPSPEPSASPFPTFPVVPSLPPFAFPTPTRTPTAVPPTSTPVVTSDQLEDPVEFFKSYISLLNNRQYEEAWDKLSPKFQAAMLRNGGGGYDEYVAYWDSVEHLDIALIEIRSLSNSEVLLYTEIKYQYKAGYTATGHTTYKLVRDSSNNSWLFAPN